MKNKENIMFSFLISVIFDEINIIADKFIKRGKKAYKFFFLFMNKRKNIFQALRLIIKSAGKVS